MNGLQMVNKLWQQEFMWHGRSLFPSCEAVVFCSLTPPFYYAKHPLPNRSENRDLTIIRSREMCYRFHLVAQSVG